MLAFVTGLGGALLRDAIFLNTGPPLTLKDWHYLPIVLVASVVGARWLERPGRFHLAFNLLDAVGLATYAIVGTQMALDEDLPIPATIFVHDLP